VEARPAQPERPQRTRRGRDHGTGGLDQRVREARIGREAGPARQRHLEPGEQRRGVDVVLQQVARHEHIAHPDVRRQPTGRADQH